MPSGLFVFENDLLKHHVRIDGWLPMCRRRLRSIQATAKRKALVRELRYLTFCAVGAIDVLMLDVVNVIRRRSGRFDSVFFFDRKNEYVAETQRRIPGAIGFAGDFVDLVLVSDPDGDADLDSTSPLDPAEEQEDIHAVRAAKVDTSRRREFIKSFPFDVINLDLEQFLLVPKEPFPGNMIRALKKIFQWQQRPLIMPSGKTEYLTGFSLMLTTQIGPPYLTDEYLTMLSEQLNNNLARDPELVALLRQRTGIDDVALLQQNNFDMFFKLGVPKMLTSILKDEDWYVDSEHGIRTYEFERPWKGGTYKMLHFVMDVVRQSPSFDRRLTRAATAEAEVAYGEVVRQFISRPERIVTMDAIDQVALQTSLDRIKERRRFYCPECPDE